MPNNIGRQDNFLGGFKPNHPGAHNGYPPRNDSTDPFEIRFARLAESWFKKYFSNFEKIIRDVNNFIVSFETTYKLLTQSFSMGSTIMKNGDQYITIFKYIWKSLKLYKLIRWLYVKCLNLLGGDVPLCQEDDKIDPSAHQNTEGSYGVLAFVGAIVSAPFLISHFIKSTPEDAMEPAHWIHSGYLVKAVRDFDANSPNKKSVRINDKLIVAPKLIQSKMNLNDSEFVFATDNKGNSGLVPINHLMMEQLEQTQTTEVKDTTGNLKDQVEAK